MSKHLSFEKISDIFDGCGTVEEKRHLHSCSECSRVFAELEMMKSRLEAAKHLKIMDDSFDDAVMKRCRGKGNMLKKRHVIPIAAAAVFAAVYFSAVFNTSNNTRSSVATETPSRPVSAVSFVTDEVSNITQLKMALSSAKVIGEGSDFVTVDASYEQYTSILRKLKIADTSRYFGLSSGLTLAGSDGERASISYDPSRRIIFTVNIRSK